MATLAEKVISEEIEKITTENGIDETRSTIVSDALVAGSSENIEASIAKEMTDSGISCKSNSDASNSANEQDGDEDSENLSQENSQEQNKLSLDGKCSQESNASSCSKTSFSSVSKKSDSSSNSTIKGTQNVNNEDDDSRSSVTSNTSTIKTSQISNKSGNKENSRSSFKSSKQSENESNLINRQNNNTDLIEDENSRLSVLSSNSRSTTKNSQPVTDKSDDEDHSRSSFKSSQKSSSQKQSDNESTFKRSQSINTDLTEDDNSRSSNINSNSLLATENSQSLIVKSDDEDNSRSIIKSTENLNKNKPKKYFAIVDSDSDDEISVTQKFKSNIKNSDSDSTVTESIKSRKSSKKSKLKNRRKVLDSDSDEESNKEGGKSGSESEKENSQSPKKSKKISNIVDSDSEGGSDNRSEPRGNASSGEDDAEKPKKGRKKSEKRRTGSARVSKDMAMQQIHSETQRLIREQEISLPYHRPKQRTLQEFLNRKKMTPVIPKNLSCAEKVKMFPDVISKVVQEKEKEAELFYKSSDSEEDERKDDLMEVDQVDSKYENKNEIQIESSNTSNLVDTQKLTQDHIQETHNKREIIQKRSSDFGVPRKLFIENTNDTEETGNLQESVSSPDKQNDFDPDDITAQERKSREVKSGLRECSIPRKLFSGDIEDMDVDMIADTNGKNIFISEEKVEKSSELPENFEKSGQPSENENDLNNSTEDIVLNMSDSELDTSDDKKLTKSKTSGLSEQNKDEDSITILETPFMSKEEFSKLNKPSTASDNRDTSKVSNPISELAEEKNEDGEILDKNVLRDDFGLPPELDENVKKSDEKKKILANALKVKPGIKASPGMVIDLTGEREMKQGTIRLLDRFVRHSMVHKPNAEEIAEVKVMRTEGSGDDITIVEEILPFKKAIAEDDPKKDRKPGEKLMKLREDLKRKIACARNEEWKQKEEHEEEDEKEAAKCIDNDFYEGLPDEEEILEDEESAESEPEEDDIPIRESRRPKCSFGDEEAEESDDVEDLENEEEEEEEENEEQNEEDEIEAEEEEEEEGEEEEEENENNEDDEESEKEEASLKPKKLKRIIIPVDDDSNDSEQNNDGIQPSNRNKTDDDIFNSQTSNGYASDNEADIPGYQRDRLGSDARSQACKTPLPKGDNMLGMFSPVTQLTALHTSLDSAKKSASKTTTMSSEERNSSEKTPSESSRLQSSCSMEKMINLQKKLFEDPPGSVNDDELLEVCSGRFADTQNSQKSDKNTHNEITDSQIMEICSGAFATQADEMKNLELNDKSSSKNNVTDSQIMDICSGAFATQKNDIKKIESSDSNPQIIDENSQDITLTLDEDENSKSPNKTSSTSAKKSDESMFSSDSKSPIENPSFDKNTCKNPLEAWLKKATEKPAQTQIQKQKQKEVTDTQLMDLCSGVFPSQVLGIKDQGTEKSQIQDETSQDFKLTFDEDSKSPRKENPATTKKSELLFSKPKKEEVKELEEPRSRFVIVSSDEEDGGKPKRPKKKKLKKKKVQKLELSDDEDNENEFSEGEESAIDEEDEENFVDYDSEENEVIVVPKKEIKKVAKKFLENEAELSESDWDSADEDEQDLDKLEAEEGDDEDIDEDKMKDQLDKIHMKQVMDEDQREVRMLQELLFDDGDLHSEGAGRERKFKWKNIDNLGDVELGPRSDDAELMDDEVDANVELQMRKMRYEQQKFLEETEKNINEGIEEDFGQSQLFKAGLKVVSVRTSSKITVGEQKLTKSNSTGKKIITISKGLTNFSRTITSTKSLSLSNMKGSFLSRGEETLVRIAQKLPETNKVPINPSRMRKFVFEHLSPTVASAPQEDSGQENDSTPGKEIKKTRKRKMFASQQTPTSTKKLKVDDRGAGKKLF